MTDFSKAWKTQRHSYQPDPVIGWDEYRVEFDGKQARRIMSHEEFSKNKPVLSIGADDQILRLCIEIAEATQTQSPGFEHIIAAQTSQIVARILARLRNCTKWNPLNCGCYLRAIQTTYTFI